MNADPLTRSIRVLQVDDEESQLEFTRLFLREFDRSIEVESIDSPVNALELVNKAPYDCVVLDYNMPVMNGLAFARKVKEGHNVPLLLYTCWSNEEVRWGDDTALIDDYVQKEIDPGHYTLLAHRIRHLTSGSRRHGHKGGIRSPEAVVIVEDGAIIYASPMIHQLLGESASQVKGRAFLDWVPEEEREALTRTVQRQQPQEEGTATFTLRNTYSGSETVKAGFVNAAYAGKEVQIYFLPLPRVAVVTAVAT